MRLTLLMVGALALAGCQDASVPAGAQEAAAAPAVHRAGSALPGVRTVPTSHGIASLPDRGTFASYDGLPPTRKSAYTTHAVSISEAHALAAIGPGRELVLRAPDGSVLRYQFSRHVEYNDGNWTWVGRKAGEQPGNEAIITFGPDAVFGTLPDAKGLPLRLYTEGGRTWLTETDPAIVATLPGAHPKGNDAIAPPARRVSGGPTAAASAPTAQSAHAEAAASSPARRVDVVLGYTSGFAARLGGQSQANTRLNFIVEVANQAYINSQIDGAVRIVRTVQVSYPDNTSNDDALYALSGKACTPRANGDLDCSDAPVPASLQPIIDARTQFGGDAVALVRNFSQAENGGCGIAWLIGAGQEAITNSDKAFAFSVVADSNGTGSNSFPSNGYICRDESFAHELGHNLGSAHDRATAAGDGGVLDANEYGRYPYSFGMKSDANNGNFFTIMSYGDSGQVRYRVFSNPNITYCGGRACGVADQIDNARSINNTITTIAGFSPAVGAVGSERDYNSDGKSDILLMKDGIVCFLMMNGTTVASNQCPASAGPGYRVIANADFNGDGRADLLLSNNNYLKMWFGNGAGGVNTQEVGGYDPSWQMTTAADLNGDGKADILMTKNGVLCMLFMNGTALTGSTCPYSAGPGFHIITTADFNADGATDVLWTNGNYLKMWFGNGMGGMSTQDVGNYDPTWTMSAAADMNGDGKSDILMTKDGVLCVLFMNGTALTSVTCPASAYSGFRIVTTGDFDGDTRADVVWTNGWFLKMWFGNGAGAFNTQEVGSYDGSWTMF